MHNLQSVNFLQKLSDFAKSRQSEIWIVGGFVRDQLLGLDVAGSDLDLVLDDDMKTFVPDFAAAEKCSYTEFNNFLTAKLASLPNTISLDIAGMRNESYSKSGALPSVISGTFEQDCQRRDFSINALYLRLADYLRDQKVLKQAVVDNTGGIDDLEKGLVRVLHDNSFKDDPTRLFRAIRYKVKISGQIETHTQSLFDLAIAEDCLSTISGQRILNEIKKASQTAYWKEALVAFNTSGLLQASKLIAHEKTDLLSNYINQVELEPFDLVCSGLYYLNSDQEKFRSLGFGKKFFKQASDNFKLFEQVKCQ